jgi:hypothetical protein
MAELIAILIFDVVSGIWAFFYSPQRTADRDIALRGVARRTGGTHVPGRPSRHAAVRWNLEGTDAVLYIPENYAGGRAQGVNFRLRFPCSFRLRLRPEGVWQRVRRFFGAQDIHFRDALFDHEFMVESDHVDRACALLTRDIRSRMARLARHGNVNLEIGPEGISLHTSETFRSEVERLSEYALAALDLGRALLRILDTSVVVSEVVASATGACPVCGTAVEEGPGRCARCKTPHHPECWEYLGGCAVYACAARPRKLVDRARTRPAEARV